MLKWCLSVVIYTCLLGSIVCPPVQPEKQKKQGPERSEEMKLGLQYERYLREIVNVLEEDDAFRKKLEETNVTEIKSGDIAKHLDMVSHSVRSRLDELKRREVDRLNQIKKLLDHKSKLDRGEAVGKQGRMGVGAAIPNVSAKVVEAMLKAQGIEDPSKGIDHHIDFNNPDTFEVEDLKKLIVQATSDLDKVDKERKKEFKTYEMTKEHLRREKLKMMSERERKEAEAKHAEERKKHMDHPKMHHPGSKDQLEEVWEETDGLDKGDFDPKTFFKLHDANGDGFLDYNEVEALFVKELDKVYDPENAEDDMVEREEEMARMREHVYGEVDTNKDGLISLEEFIESTKQKDFDEDAPWDPIDDDQEFTDDEFDEFEQHINLEEMDAQPGEVNIPHIEPSVIPQLDNDLRVPVGGGDHLGGGQGQAQGVQHMQQPGQGPPIVQDANPPAQPPPQQAQQLDPNQKQPVQNQQQPVQNQQPPVQNQQPPVQNQQQPVQNQQPPVQNQQPPVQNQQQPQGQPQVNQQPPQQ